MRLNCVCDCALSAKNIILSQSVDAARSAGSVLSRHRKVSKLRNTTTNVLAADCARRFASLEPASTCHVPESETRFKIMEKGVEDVQEGKDDAKKADEEAEENRV